MLGNALALVAALVGLYAVTLKKKKKILYFQTLQLCLLGISNFILGGMSAVIINMVSIIRNILCYKNKFKTKEKVIMIIILTALIIVFNNIGTMGLLPLISTIIFTLFMDIKDTKKYKILIVITLIPWVIYDIAIDAYVTAIFDSVTIIVSFVTVFLPRLKF